MRVACILGSAKIEIDFLLCGIGDCGGGGGGGGGGGYCFKSF